jgi:hypothetical protein
MTQSDVAGLADPTTKLLCLVIVIQAPPTTDWFSSRIASAAFAYGGFGWRGLLEPHDHLHALLDADLADRMTLESIAATIVPKVFGDGLADATLVADTMG